MLTANWVSRTHIIINKRLQRRKRQPAVGARIPNCQPKKNSRRVLTTSFSTHQTKRKVKQYLCLVPKENFPFFSVFAHTIRRICVADVVGLPSAPVAMIRMWYQRTEYTKRNCWKIRRRRLAKRIQFIPCSENRQSRKWRKTEERDG